MESDDNLNRELSVLVSLVAAADAFRGLWGNFGGNTLTRDGSLKLRHASFVMDFRDATLLCEILWLSMPGEEPIALHPGLDLSALLRDLKSRGARLNFREEEDRKRLAALALLVSDPPRFPLAEGQDLPLAPGAFRPRISSSEFWRRSHVSKTPGGPQVELTWIEDANLVRGRVLTTNDGVGVRELPGSQTLAQNVQWAIPLYMESEGRWSALRIVGVISAANVGPKRL